MPVRSSLGLVIGCLSLAACSAERARSPQATSTVDRAHGDVSTVVAPAEWKAVIEDWFVDGVVDEPHRCAAVRVAIQKLPSSPPDYSSVYDDLRRVERRACG